MNQQHSQQPNHNGNYNHHQNVLNHQGLNQYQQIHSFPLSHKENHSSSSVTMVPSDIENNSERDLLKRFPNNHIASNFSLSQNSQLDQLQHPHKYPLIFHQPSVSIEHLSKNTLESDYKTNEKSVVLHEFKQPQHYQQKPLTQMESSQPLQQQQSQQPFTQIMMPISVPYPPYFNSYNFPVTSTHSALSTTSSSSSSQNKNFLPNLPQPSEISINNNNNYSHVYNVPTYSDNNIVYSNRLPLPSTQYQNSAQLLPQPIIYSTARTAIPATTTTTTTTTTAAAATATATATAMQPTDLPLSNIEYHQQQSSYTPYQSYHPYQPYQFYQSNQPYQPYQPYQRYDESNLISSNGEQHLKPLFTTSQPLYQTTYLNNRYSSNSNFNNDDVIINKNDNSSYNEDLGHVIKTAVPWSIKESKILMKLRDQGLTWKEISSHFPNRTLNACQFRWKRITMNGGIDWKSDDNSETENKNKNKRNNETEKDSEEIEIVSEIGLKRSSEENKHELSSNFKKLKTE
jgi:hypothetical protein